MRQCEVYVHDVMAGVLAETDAREYVFTYCDDYRGEPVCLAMPVRKESYRSSHLFPYFFNMLSEGANRQEQTLLYALTQDFDENGKLIERRFYYDEGTLYADLGPEPGPLMDQMVYLTANELRHGFDWLIQNPKE